MLFPILKKFSRLLLPLWCRKIVVDQPLWFKAEGPILLAANHPNSFLDGILMSTLFERNIYSLARGDAFKKRWHQWVLHRFNMLPVYRTSEGVENLEHNYETFAACEKVFDQKGIVLIFSEGRCINEWHLRPLKKGTARLALRSWSKGIDLTVLPVAINYNPFRNYGKNISIRFGEPLNRDEIMAHRSDGKLISAFNEKLAQQLSGLVYEIQNDDLTRQKQLLTFPLPMWKRMVLFIPAVVGFIIHLPLYYAAKLATTIFFNNDHFDSVMVSLLLLVYPLFLISLFVTAAIHYTVMGAVSLLLIVPVTAYAAVQLKPQC